MKRPHRASGEGFPAHEVVVVTSILGFMASNDRPERRRATRGREMPLETALKPDPVSLPALPDTEIQARWLVPHPWRLESVQDGGRRLIVSVVGQLAPAAVRVTETADDVSVTVYVRLASPGSLIRIAAIFVSVMLNEPLGERRLIDGAG